MQGPRRRPAESEL